MNGKIRRPWLLRGGRVSGAEPARPRPLSPPAPRPSRQSSASCRRCLWCLWHSAGHGLLRPTATVSGPDRPGLSGLPDSPLRGLLATTDAGTRVARNTTSSMFYFSRVSLKFSLNTNPKYVRWTKTFKRNCVVQNHQPILFFDKISLSLLLNLTNVETKSSKEIRYGILKSRSLRTPVSILICKRLVFNVVRKYLIYYLNIRHHSSLFQIRFSQKENPNLNW